MCTMASGALTLAGLVSDPLTQAMMRSDGVSARELTALLVRVQDTLAARAERGVKAPAPAGA